MPKIRVSNKDRVEDDVMEEILQDPARFEELLREREKPPAKPVKKFVSPVPSRQSGRRRESERVAVAGKDGESGVTESPPITKLVSENPLREPWIFVQGEDHTKDHYRPLTDKEWIKWRNEDPVSFDDRYEPCEEGPAMYKKRSTTSSRKTTAAKAPEQDPIDWDEVEGEERSETFRQQFVGKDGTKPFDYVGRDMERRKFVPARDGDHPAYTVPILSHRQQEVIGGLLSLSRVQTSETGTESDSDTVKLPRESERKSLVDLNPDLFPPIRKSMGSVDLAMLDELGSDKPYKKGGKGRHEPPVKRISIAPQKCDLR